jgi:hypothetical protein
VVVSGVADLGSGAVRFPSGGVLLGGSVAVASRITVVTDAGGVVVSGSVTVALVLAVAASGGVAIGGTVELGTPVDPDPVPWIGVLVGDSSRGALVGSSARGGLVTGW